MQQITKFLIDIVKKSYLLISDKVEVQEKDTQGDLVTNFDFLIEQHLIKSIKEKYPKFDIVSEEYNSSKELTDNCFTVDPLDGTINFANGLPLWGIQVACIKNGKTCSAVIYLPELNELYYADKEGSFLNGKAIKVNNSTPFRSLYTVESKENYKLLSKLKKELPHLRFFWCAAIDFAWTAAGKLGGTLCGLDTPWDYIPGMYLVKQAGGFTYSDKNVNIATNSVELCEIFKKRK